MDRPDDEFEAMLRQFRPRKPNALPTSPRPLLAVAAAAIAAVIVAAVVIPLRFRSISLAAPGFTQAPASTPSVTTGSADAITQRDRQEVQPAVTPNRVPDAKPMPPERERSRAVVSDPPTLSPLAGVTALGSAPLKGLTGRAGAAIGTDHRRVRVGRAVKAPTKVFDVKPVYPKDAQDAGIQGVVTLEIVIGEHGAVIETRVVDSIPELDQAAIDAVIQWRFEPTLLNGEPVEVEMNVMINFTLSR